MEKENKIRNVIEEAIEYQAFCTQLVIEYWINFHTL